jgi:hypothetical protein
MINIAEAIERLSTRTYRWDDPQLCLDVSALIAEVKRLSAPVAGSYEKAKRAACKSCAEGLPYSRELYT